MNQNILQVFNSRINKHGSFEDFMIELARQSKEKDIRLRFVFPQINTEEVKKELEEHGAKVSIISAPWSSLRFVKELLAIVNDRMGLLRSASAGWPRHSLGHFALGRNDNIVDFHFCTSINLVLLFLLLRLSGVKVVFHYHGEISPIEQLKFVNRHFSKLRLVTLFANKIICVSEANKKFLEALNIRKHIDVVYNGVKIENFSNLQSDRDFRREMNFTNGELLITYIASLIPRKGIDVLIRAAKDVTREIPNARFIFVGGGDKAPYQKLAGDLGMSDKVMFTGLIKEYPYYILKDTDLFVSSSFAESFGLSIAEAQLLGVPVVATRVGGVPEVVNDGKSGVLVPAGDSRSLALEIIRLLKDDSLRKDLGHFGKKWIAEKFDLKDKVEELIDVCIH